MILQEIEDYSKNCIEGKITSCKKHKWACERFIRDVQKMRIGKSDYYWDEEAAQNIVDWFALLRHSKGILAGQPLSDMVTYRHVEENLIEELADVKLVLDQVIFLLAVDEDVQEIMKQKIERTLERIGEQNAGN